jgi:hypothetical protein
MWRFMLLISIWILVLMTSAAIADDGFSCGGAEVRFHFEIQHGFEDHVAVDVIFSRDGQQSVLRYDGNIDFIGGVCVKNKRGKPTIVFQAFCSGSGCADLENWGIVSPSDLRVLLVPNDWNMDDARKILGRPLPKIEKMISLEDVGQNLGIK